MTAEKTKPTYCFDTDAFVTSWRLHYRNKSFSELWDYLSELIAEGRLIICEEVEKEIGVGKDDLVAWLKKNKACVSTLSAEEIVIATDIVNKYPAVSQYKKPRPNHADPFVVALAKVKGCTVVTYEKDNGNKVDPKVPALCKEYSVDCCSIYDLFEKENLSFKLK